MSLRRQLAEAGRSFTRRAAIRLDFVRPPRPLPPCGGWSDAERRRLLEHLLLRNVLPFWERTVLDGRDGYPLHHDVRGIWRGPGPRRFVTQARTVWFWSALSGTRWRRDAHLDAALRGFAYLRDRLWDRRHGGWFWEVDAAGAVTRPDKHVYAQAFAIYALSELALASGDPRPGEMADETFELLEHRGRDEALGCYGEWYDRDWGALPSWRRNDFDVGPDARLMDTALHLVEALTRYRALRPRDERVRRRLVETTGLMVDRMAPGHTGDVYELDWMPRSGARISYGHHAESAWIVIDAAQEADGSPEAGVDPARAFFRNALRGFDERDGGFFSAGDPGGGVTDRAKVWWPQAEGLVAALRIHKQTGDARATRVFDRTLAWILARQADWRNGDWHARVLFDGRHAGDKAGVWKCPYHQGRALLRCLDLLARANRARR